MGLAYSVPLYKTIVENHNQDINVAIQDTGYLHSCQGPLMLPPPFFFLAIYTFNALLYPHPIPSIPYNPFPTDNY